MNTSTTLDFPIVYTRAKQHSDEFLAILNVGRFDQWIKVDITTVLPPNPKGLVPIDQITQINGLVSFQMIMNGYLCSVCSLRQFISNYGLGGTWNAQYEGYFPTNMIDSCKKSIIQGPIESIMKSIDIILKKKAVGCDLIAYVNLRDERITYVVKPKSIKIGTEIAKGYIILRKAKETSDT